MAYCLKCGEKAERKIPMGDQKPRIVCPKCAYIHYENPKVICGTLVVHDNKVLMCRRAIEPRYGFWTLPAGFMEIGETLVEGALRETIEEADAVGINPHLFCVYDIPSIGQVYVIYLAELKDGHFGTGVESLECALFSEEDIPWNDIAFEAVHRTLTHYFTDRQRYDVHTNFKLHYDAISKDKRMDS